MTDASRKPRRRIMLAAGLGAMTGGATLAWRWGLFSAYPHGSPLRLDIGDLPEGRLRTVEWRGLPVWVMRRNAVEVAALAAHEAELADPESRQSLQPATCRNRQRSLRPDIFVAVGLCTHQGCTPALRADTFLCPCHASRYDLAGRVYRTGPATANLVIPAYHFETGRWLVLGLDA